MRKYNWLYLILGIVLLFSISYTSAAFNISGGTFYQSGGYDIHVFNANDTAIVTGSGTITELFVVGAGGGGGGTNGDGAAGGGAGGLVDATNLAVSAGNFPIFVGTGGQGGVLFNYGQNGQNSSAFGLVGFAGGGGAEGRDGNSNHNGNNGGSGGGGSRLGTGGSRLQINFSNGTAYGNSGGGDGVNTGTHGGGGATSVGATGTGNNGGNGGAGFNSSINGTLVCYAGGGGGGAFNDGVRTAGSASCGGGNGSYSSSGQNGYNGINGTGGGGGGASGSANGGYGGNGVVIIKFIAQGALAVTLNSPANNFNTTSNSINFNATLTPSGATLTNTTFYVWFSNGTLVSTNTNTTFNGNISTFTSTVPIFSNYLWNAFGVQGNGNGTNSTFAAQNNTFTYTFLTTNQYFFNGSNFETAHDFYIVNITSAVAPTAANLVYNNTLIVPTNITSLGNNFYNISAQTDIPVGVSNNSFYFNVTGGGFSQNTQINYQNILTSNLTFASNASCSNGLPFLNLSFQDESNQTSLNGILNALTFNYWLGQGTFFKTLITSNSSANPYYLGCFSPSNQTLNENYSISYSASGYPIRTLVSSGSLTSSFINQTLYSMAQSSGIAVTFQVVNSATQPLSGVLANATRNVNGNIISVGSGLTDSGGGITFFVNPLLTYTFTFSKSGFPTSTLTTTPSQSGYTITMGQSSSTTSDYTKGITIAITPTLDTTIFNNTNQYFNYTINSTFWSLTSFNFTIFGNYTQFITSQQGTTASGGTIFALVNTSNYTTITMNFSYTTNSTTTSSSITWYIQNSNSGSFSISNLVSDLKAFINLAIFGATNFAVAILIFITILVSLGFVINKFGFVSEASLVAILTGLVIFFDVGLNLDSYLNPLQSTGAVPFLPSVIMLIIAVTTIIREGTR